MDVEVAQVEVFDKNQMDQTIGLAIFQDFGVAHTPQFLRSLEKNEREFLEDILKRSFKNKTKDSPIRLTTEILSFRTSSDNLGYKTDLSIIYRLVLGQLKVNLLFWTLIVRP